MKTRPSVGRNGKPSDAVVLRLLLEHGGRCAVCNKWLAADPIFFLSGNYREIAHIIGASKNGPRGKAEKLTTEQRHAIENLVPLCKDDHKTVDGPHREDYPPERLRKIKADHSKMIRHLCDQAALPPSLIIKCQAHIGDVKVAVTPNIVAMALNGKRPHDQEGLLIDFSSLTGNETAQVLQERSAEVSRLVKNGLTSKITGTPVSHVSIFAIGPIPLLVSLGAAVGRAFPTDYFHFNSAQQTWKWPDAGKKIKFKSTKIREGSSGEAVILISCSGTIKTEDVEKHVKKDAWVFQIQPADKAPQLNLIDHPESVVSFVQEYDALRSILRSTIPGLKKIHLFQASPPPIAIASGQHLLAKVDPAVLVYDYRKTEASFIPILEVNSQ